MEKARILLVQNSRTNGNGTRKFLESAGYDVLWAGSGLSARIIASNEPVNLILLDVALPDTEGLDLCRRFRNSAGMRSIPIILLVGRGFTPGSPARPGERPDDYLEKPYTESDLKSKLDEVLSRRSAVADGPTPDGAGSVHAPEEVSNTRTDAEPKTARRPVLKLVPKLSPPASPVEEHAADQGEEIIDPTTGLFSRPQFEAMFSKSFKQYLRFKQQMSCMMIDLDGSKMGRTADETLVKAIVGLLQQTIREVDTAAWWSGESFIVLLPNTTHNDAVQAAARVLEAVANHPFTWPDATRVTMSIGVAGLPDPTIDTEQKLIDAAAGACRKALEGMERLPHAMHGKTFSRKALAKNVAG